MRRSSSSSSAQDLPSVDALRAIYADKQVGESFEFGRYPQGVDGEIEPIIWRVLQREEDHLLVIAEQCLVCKPYDDEPYVEYHSVTWSDCTLRCWLNSNFYGKAFNEQERECISKTSIANNAGLKTEDYIFLLSADEARSLFANDSLRRVAPPDNQLDSIPWAGGEYGGCCYWWLRSRGNDDGRAAYVDSNGSVNNFGDSIRKEFNAVRPALRLALQTAALAPFQLTDSLKLVAVPKPDVSSLRDNYANKRLGELFEFGRYPQGANGEIEPITWRVLQREADHLLVIAEQGLDCKPYNEELRNVTWADSTLRRWLNSVLYDKALNAQERECILKTSIVNNAGPNTEDNIFLLSVEEAISWFVNDRDRCAKVTEYAVDNGASACSFSDLIFNGCCIWWLRSRGNDNGCAAYVDVDGGVHGDDIAYGVFGSVHGSALGSVLCIGTDVNGDFIAVRPAIKLAL